MLRIEKEGDPDNKGKKWTCVAVKPGESSCGHAHHNRGIFTSLTNKDHAHDNNGKCEHNHADHRSHEPEEKSHNRGFLHAAFSKVKGDAGEWLMRHRRKIVLGSAGACAVAEATTGHHGMASLVLLFASAAVAHDASEDVMETISNLKESQNLSAGVIGTAIGFGHTLGEAALSAVSTLNGSSDLAVSSVMGSQPSHILLMAGGAAVIGTIGARKDTSWKLHAGAMAGLAALFGAQVASGEFIPAAGAAMMAGGGYYLYRRFKDGEGCIAHGSSCSSHHDHGASNRITLRQRIADPHLLKLGASVTALGASAHVLAHEILIIADKAGISETAAGASIAAISMAAPEIILTWKAAHKGEKDMAWGTVAGCATATIEIVGGGLALSGVDIPHSLSLSTPEGMLHISAFAGSTAAIVVATHPRLNKSGKISKALGASALALYAAYTAATIQIGGQSQRICHTDITLHGPVQHCYGLEKLPENLPTLDGLSR